MNDQARFRGYDRAEMDRQYDNRARVPEHVAIHKAWDADGEAAVREFDHKLDQAFGPSPAETLDIFMPKGAEKAPKGNAKGAPVNVFLHGGYWMGRHKNEFRFIARGLVPAGAVAVIVNYALVPAVAIDELIRQCRAAVAWAWRNASSFGGDPERIFVSGHSAGGHLAAMMMATDWTKFAAGLPSDLVKGGCAMSGIHELEPVRHCYLQDTLGLTAEEAARLSPVAMTPATDAPLIVAVGGEESDELIRHSRDLARAWKGRVKKCELMVMPGINHFTILSEFTNPKSALSKAVKAQMGLA